MKKNKSDRETARPTPLPPTTTPSHRLPTPPQVKLLFEPE